MKYLHLACLGLTVFGAVNWALGMWGTDLIALTVGDLRGRTDDLLRLTTVLSAGVTLWAGLSK